MNTSSKNPRLHGLLIIPLELERLPWWLTFFVLVGVAGLSALAWWPPLRLWMAGMLLGFSMADWLSLALLPRLNRSFGPVKPPLLALAGVRAGLSSLFGLLWPVAGVAAILHVLLLVVSLYATWVEPFRLHVTHQILCSDRLSRDAPPLRVLHLGDLHIERLTRREAHLQRLVADLAPDLILFSGDFVSLSYRHDPTSIRGIRHIVGQWRAPLGVYCVSGTPLVETSEDVADFVTGTELHWLRDETVTVEAGGHQLTLVGLDGALWREDVLPRLQAVAENLPAPDGFRLLLYHTPDVAPEAAELGFDLYLCGHTHGGQIRLPLYGAIVTASRFGKRFEMGRYRVGPMTLYVTRGIGMEGGAAPRARFLCPPEVVLWTLRGESPSV